jgi:HPt (histidine-containing phosphotransfer) domain-containing protein
VTDNEQILNLNTINELKEILDDDIVDIYLEFQSCTLEMIKELKESQIKGDTDAITHISHTIKGSSGNLGLQGIFLLSQELEVGLRENKGIDTSALITKIEDTYFNTISELVKAGLLPE